MKNPSWYEEAPEDPEEEQEEDLNWDTPTNHPYVEKDCNYWNQTT